MTKTLCRVTLVAAGLTVSTSSWALTVYETGGDFATQPTIVNVFWESSLEAFDEDVSIGFSGVPGNPVLPTWANIEALTRAMAASRYFQGMVADYSVTNWAVVQPIVLGKACPGFPVPATTAVGRQNVEDFAATFPLQNCLNDALFALGAPPLTNSTIINFIYPPQVTPGGDGSSPGLSCTPTTSNAYHQFIGDASVYNATFIPTNPACNRNTGLQGVFQSMSHEMVEAITDPHPLSLGGYRSWLHYFNGQSQEIADLCQGGSGPPNEPATTPFLGALFSTNLSNYWSNGNQGCWPGFGVNTFAPSVVSAGVGTDAGVHFAFKVFDPGFVPWDLPGNPFMNIQGPMPLLASATGAKTMYLRMTVNPPGQPSWTVGGGFFSSPPDAINFYKLSYSSDLVNTTMIRATNWTPRFPTRAPCPRPTRSTSS
jgi:hypothetical protein